MNKFIFCGLAISVSLAFSGCNNTNSGKEVSNEEVVTPEISVPEFNEDSAYFYVGKQVSFGPRVPNTEGHEKTAAYLVEKLQEFGGNVEVQEFAATTFDNNELQLKNIIASFYPQAGRRVLLAAHWDTRPFADKDTVRQNEPIDGANDGASGVGVLLEIARVLANSPEPGIGIDIIFFDGEDWGNDGSVNGTVQTPQGLDSWWCLGSQYWSKMPHKPNYSAYYGILLDMVGGENAMFYKEGYSMEYAPLIVKKVWNTASRIGYSGTFIPNSAGYVTDDHIFVNQYRKIPMIDIIPNDPEDNSFGDFHHTHGDNMDIISKKTLDAVGETLLHVLYEEGAAFTSQ